MENLTPEVVISLCASGIGLAALALTWIGYKLSNRSNLNGLKEARRNGKQVKDLFNKITKRK